MSDKMSEVEAAKKAVLAVYPDSYMRGPQYAADVWILKEEPGGTWLGEGKTEDEAWLDAARKLAPLTEDAPKATSSDGQCTGPFSDAKDCPVHNPSKVPASPVGELEGAFEAWKHYNFHKYFHHPDSDIRVAIAYAAWQYRAALSSKPAPEGIPERPKKETVKQFATALTSMSFIQYAEFKRWAESVEAIISAKDAEIATLTGDLDAVAGHIGQITKLIRRAEAAEAELAALRLSSTKVREEGKAEGLKSAIKAVMEQKSPCDGSSEWMSANCVLDGSVTAILSLLPTSPESQEVK